MANVSVANTSASISGKTIATLEGSQTVTGAKTFDLGASAPFVVVSGAAKVTNLDADKLDGAEGTDYHDAAQLTGVLPVTVVGADPNADRIVFWDDSAGAYAFLELVTGLASISGTQLTIPVDRGIVQGRLTLTTALPVTTSDVTAATTLYWALYQGNQIALYNGTVWVMFALSQLSIAVPATTNQMYDVFVDYNAGTPALSLTAWTNDTTRATALTTQDGVLVLTGSTGKRFVGVMRTTGVSGETEDSIAKRFVRNYYNRVSRPLSAVSATASRAYTTAAWEQSLNEAANKVEFINGVSEDAVTMRARGSWSNTAGARLGVGIGIDSTSAVSGRTASADGNGSYAGGEASYNGFPGIGYHYAAWLEYGGTGGLFYGTSAPEIAGISGEILG